MADEGWMMDGFGSGYATPEGRRAAVRARLEHGSAGVPEYEGPYIDPSMTDQEVADRLREYYYENSAAWANPQQRAAGMAEYAKGGPLGTPEEFRGRWGEAKDLLDPHTAKNKWAMADAEFLDAYSKWEDASASRDSRLAPSDSFEPFGGQDDTAERRKILQGLTDDFGREASSPLAHANQRGIISAITDPEKPVGMYGNNINAFPAAAKMYVTAETETVPDALAAGYGNAMANKRFRQYTNTPVVDLPASASPEELRERLGRIRGDQQIAAEPGARERWLMTHNYDPPEWLKRASDLAMDFIDPTIIPDIKDLLTVGVRSVTRAAANAGKRPSMVKEAAKTLAPDAAAEGAFIGLAGNTDVNYGTEENPSFVKTAKQREQAAEQRRENEINSLRLPSDYDAAYNRGLQEAKQRNGVRGLLGGIRN